MSSVKDYCHKVRLPITEFTFLLRILCRFVLRNQSSEKRSQVGLLASLVPYQFSMKNSMGKGGGGLEVNELERKQGGH